MVSASCLPASCFQGANRYSRRRASLAGKGMGKNGDAQRGRFEQLTSSYIRTCASTGVSGIISSKWRLRTVALGRPTSARVATAWRFREERVTCGWGRGAQSDLLYLRVGVGWRAAFGGEAGDGMQVW